MNKVANLTVKHILDSMEHKIYLLCIGLASLFTVFQYAYDDYSSMVLHSFTNPNLLIVIIYPIFALLSNQIFKFFNYNTSTSLRLTSRSKFLKTTVYSIFRVTFIVFIETIIINLIICNIAPHEPFVISRIFEYNSLDIFVTIVCIIKVYLTILSICIFNICLNYLFSKQSFALIITFIFILSLFLFQHLAPSNLVEFIINPGINSHGFSYTNNIYHLIISSIIYFPVFYTLFFFLASKFLKIKDIGV